MTTTTTTTTTTATSGKLPQRHEATTRVFSLRLLLLFFGVCISIWANLFYTNTFRFLRSSANKQLLYEDDDDDNNDDNNAIFTMNHETWEDYHDQHVERVTSRRQNNVIVFVFNERYASAIIDSIHSLRSVGNYTGDVAAILEETDETYNVTSFQRALQAEFPRRRRLQEEDGSVAGIHTFSTQELYDELNLGPEAQFLRQPPDVAECKHTQRAKGHTAYYRKLLGYHPKFAERWDRILLLDACMSFHAPHVDALFEMAEIKDHLLATPDPWIWRQEKLEKEVLSCIPAEQLDLLKHLVGHDLQGGYFNSAFVMYDAKIVRDYKRVTGTSSSTLVELLHLAHSLGQTFNSGDQALQSVYWKYMRDKFSTLPMELLDHEYVPYEFMARLPEQPHIVTAGHHKRAVCQARPTNKRSVNSFSSMPNLNKDQK